MPVAAIRGASDGWRRRPRQPSLYEAYGPERPHALWSVSKTIAGALLGIAVRDGKISLEQKLEEFYPRPDAGGGDFEQVPVLMRMTARA